MKVSPEGIDQYIDSLILEGSLSEQIHNLALSIRSSGDIRKVIYKLRGKEEKGTSYAVSFINSYTASIGVVGYVSYKHCALISKTEARECLCVFEEKRSFQKEIDDLKTALGLLKKSQIEDTKKLIFSLTDMVMHNFSRKELLSTASLIMGLEALDHTVNVKLIEYAHAFHHLGMDFEAFKVLEQISKTEKVTPSTDRMRLMIMAKYFLKGESYRGYLCAIDRLQQLQVQISPLSGCQEYAQHQRVVTDYDRIIGYKAPAKKPPVPGFPTVFTVPINHQHWAWYLSAIGTEEDLSLEETGKIAFLRKHRLNHSVGKGKLQVLSGNTRYSYIDYITDLEEKTEKERYLPHDRTAQGMSQTSQTSTTSQTQTSQTSATLAQRQEARKQRAALKTLFEEKEYLLRLTLQKKEETSYYDESEALTRVNQRFRKAKEENLRIVQKIVASFSAIGELKNLLFEEEAARELVKELDTERVADTEQEEPEAPSPSTELAPETPAVAELSWKRDHHAPEPTEPRTSYTTGYTTGYTTSFNSSASTSHPPASTEKPAWKVNKEEPRTEHKDLIWGHVSGSTPQTQPTPQPQTTPQTQPTPQPQTQPQTQFYQPKDVSEESLARFIKAPDSFKRSDKQTRTDTPTDIPKGSWRKRG
ncbi:hypothetical protein NEDG_01405 [Nematocida displodere]|uniref:Uncharacterized protein n=1 Tax=Nematocida displodere TaxID=1805483 RepID=A0A177EDU1_9MICR|nr:hypothetical protein NEDG_01405 [Nematocida displodere]